MIININPDNPQGRLVAKVVDIIQDGGLIIYPTDTQYGLGCDLTNKKAIEKVYRLKQRSQKSPFSFVCADLTNISEYAKVSNFAYRTMRRLLPGPYTFILEATKEVPRRVSHPSRKTIGVRVPQNAVAHNLLMEMAQPLLATTLILPGDEHALNDAVDIRDRLEHQVDLVLDAGPCPSEPTTVVDLCGAEPVVIRIGRGPVGALGLPALQ